MKKLSFPKMSWNLRPRSRTCPLFHSSFVKSGHIRTLQDFCGQVRTFRYLSSSVSDS